MKKLNRTSLASTLSLGLALAACAHDAKEPPAQATAGAASAAAALTPAADTIADWPSYNNTLDSIRFSNLAEINTQNVKSLKVLCEYDTKETVSFQTSLVEVNGALYGTTEQDTFAIDPNTCKEIWRAHENYPKTILNVNRGVAVMDGKVFRGLNNGTVVAYDEKTGKKTWTTKISDKPKVEMIDASPIAHDGLVYIGNAGGDNKGVKGRMYALEAATGKIAWEFYLVPKEEKDKARGPQGKSPSTIGTWKNKQGIPITGGGVWTTFTYDVESNSLIVPGGNPAPDFVKDVREGENLYAGSVVQLDGKTGDYQKHFPIVLDDFHDYDVSSAPALIKTRGGKSIMAVTPKDGHLYIIDRSNNKQIARLAMTTIENEKEPLTKSGTRFCPGTQGGSEWNGPAYSRLTNLIYSGQVDWCSTVRLTGKDTLAAVPMNQPWTGVDPKDKKELYGKLDDQSKRAGWVVATDADSAQKAWTFKTKGPILGAVTATAGDLILTGDMDGIFYALDAKTGANLWQYDLPGAVGGGVISYNTGKGQKIAVAAGMTSMNWPSKKSTAKVIVMGL